MDYEIENCSSGCARAGLLLLLLTLVDGFWLLTPLFELFTLSFRLAKKLTIGTQDVRGRHWPAVSTCCSLFKVIHRFPISIFFLIIGGYSTFLVVFLFLILNKFSFFLFVSTRYRRFLWMHINLMFPILPVLVLVRKRFIKSRLCMLWKGHNPKVHFQDVWRGHRRVPEGPSVSQGGPAGTSLS